MKIIDISFLVSMLLMMTITMMTTTLFHRVSSYRLFTSNHIKSNRRMHLISAIVTNQNVADITTTSSSSSTKESRSLMDQVSTASIASAAVLAATAVNAAVSMRSLSAPDVSKTYVYRDGAAVNRTGIIDEVGLPLVYDKDLIQMYWKKQGSALTQRWTEFLSYAVPYLTKVITLIVSGGSQELNNNAGILARDARVIFEKLGPTYVKLGQMMSVRPDVLPKEALEELKILQDSVKPFDTKTAIDQIESELKGSLGEFFSEISDKPVAAASLAQVYKAKLSATGEYVAVKIQRPRVLETVSKDLYVLRRAAEVYQGLVDRFLPQQRTNYVGLLNEWAIGFYTELDFLNEAANQQRLRDLLQKEGVDTVYVPKVYHELCTRRVLVSEWVDGIKLSEAEDKVIKTLIPGAQEAFLTQLLQIGFLHADPHPGNLLYLNEARGNAKLALIDFGLVASIKQSDMDTMISCVIHLANRDYASLVDDFIQLGILPQDCDRAKVIPLMDKALTPYVKGGGAQKYEQELRKTYGLDGTLRGNAGGFQQMTQDALTIMNDIPFSIPPYFALLGRAIVTLEGIALTGDPSYGIIMEAYPFVARKLLSEDRPEIQRALQQVLYSTNQIFNSENKLQTTRLGVLINSALGIVSKSDSSFVDFDTLPEETATLESALKLLLSPKAKSLRGILIQEIVNGLDILLRQATRKSYQSFTRQVSSSTLSSISKPLFGFINTMGLSSVIPRPETIPIPLLIPSKPILENTMKSISKFLANGGSISESMISFSTTTQTSSNTQNFIPIFAKPIDIIDNIAPKLNREEELYGISLIDVIKQTIGPKTAAIMNGDAIDDPMSVVRFILSIFSMSINGKDENSFAISLMRRILNSINRDTDLSSDSNIKEVIRTINELEKDERLILQQVIDEVLQSLSTRLFRRLQSKYLLTSSLA